MSASSPLRIAVVGAGHMGGHHARKVAELAAADGSVALRAVVDRDAERAGVLARELGAPTSPADASLAGTVDAVIVAVPTVEHERVVGAAIDDGLDVLVEKPIAATLPEAEKLVALARERGRVLQVGHLEWFNAAMQRAVAAIRRPRFVECHRLGPFPARATDVDVVRDLMIHDLDLVQRIVGEEPERIDAIGVPVITERVDIANARLAFPGGCIANLTASRVSPTPMRKVRFFQPDGYFSVDLLEQSVTIAMRVEEGAKPPGAQVVFDFHGHEVALETLEIDREDALLNQLRAFRDAVATRSVAAGAGDQGLSALRTALRVIDAMPAPEALA